MKKLLSLLLAVLMLLSLTACGEAMDILDGAIEVASDLEEIASGLEEISTDPEEITQPAETESNEEAEEAISSEDAFTDESTEESETTPQLDIDGIYTSKEDVALYIHLYGKLPKNFMTKSEARKLGWEGGSLEPYAPNMCIGGDYFGNYEELLPTDRTYRECDIDTLGAKSRGAKRLVFSDDGLIYYTEDHYETFELLYGEP